MRRLLLASLLVLGTAGGARAACTPDGFTFTHDGMYWTLTGNLDTPSPGYRGRLSEDRSGQPNAWVYALRAPPGGALAVIAQHEVKLRGRFDKAQPGPVRIRIDKDFAWGPDAIACTIAAR
jgi:hypothetical protein